MSLNVLMNTVPDSVCNNWLSRNSRNCWTCGASSEPYVAVAIRQPPSFSEVSDSSTSDTKINESVSPQDFSISLEQNLYTGGKFTAEAKKAKSQLLIEEENLRLTRYEIILESALAYLNVL